MEVFAKESGIRRRTRALAVLALTVGAMLALVVVSSGAMRSEKISNRLCETTGGGRFVKVPGFPGERVDRRLLNDIRWMHRRYKIFITDGYSKDPVHAANGEHPIGLALDIVPDKAAGGRWRDITALAEWAEPKQDRPRAPFRWVGYEGDAGHGKRNHLHLSWNHSPADFGEPARKVWTVKCPGERTVKDGSDGGGTGGTGGVSTDGSGGGTRGGTGSSGGIGALRLGSERLGPTVVETGGVSLR